MLDNQHDLIEFLHQVTEEIESEYNRIQKRALEDPGTAGDQGEENWANILRGWLPPSYRVVTKGRLIGQSGEMSPQVDVIILKPSYPEKLKDKKVYLAAGVAGAFECKITLKAKDVEKAVGTCAIVKSLIPQRIGTQHRETHTPLIYGLLAHSHVWKSKTSKPFENIEKRLITADIMYCNHPRLQIDQLCVADLTIWTQIYSPFIGPKTWGDQTWQSMTSVLGANGYATTGFIRHTRPPDRTAGRFSPIGLFIMNLVERLGWDDPSCRALARYYRVVLTHSGHGQQRRWYSSIFSPTIRDAVESGHFLPNSGVWDDYEAGIMPN